MALNVDSPGAATIPAAESTRRNIHLGYILHVCRMGKRRNENVIIPRLLVAVWRIR
jgi:hypothetical protein